MEVRTAATNEARPSIAAAKTKVDLRAAEKTSLEEAADNSPGREAGVFGQLE